MTYVAILDSTLAKLTDEEKRNLQDSLDSYFKEGVLKGYEDGYDEGRETGDDYGYERGYDNGFDRGYDTGMESNQCDHEEDY